MYNQASKCAIQHTVGWLKPTEIKMVAAKTASGIKCWGAALVSLAVICVAVASRLTVIQ